MNDVLVDIKGSWLSSKLGQSFISVEDLCVKLESAIEKIEDIEDNYNLIPKDISKEEDK